MKTTAIILAAGKGSRMHSKIEKQFMELGGYPVIYYALKAFEESPVDSIILVTGKNSVEYCRHEIIEKYHFTKVVSVVEAVKIGMILYIMVCVHVRDRLCHDP